MDMKTTVSGFIADLASPSPAPGGGSASALSGSMGAALLEMAVRITKNISDGDGEVPLLREIPLLREQCFQLIEEDAEAFRKVMEAYRLPKGDDGEKRRRSSAIQEALRGATEVPLRTAETCLEIITCAGAVIALCKESCISDAMVGFYSAEAGFHGAMANVDINLPSLKDPGVKCMMTERRDALAVKQPESSAQVRSHMAFRMQP